MKINRTTIRSGNYLLERLRPILHELTTVWFRRAIIANSSCKSVTFDFPDMASPTIVDITYLPTQRISIKSLVSWSPRCVFRLNGIHLHLSTTFTQSGGVLVLCDNCILHTYGLCETIAHYHKPTALLSIIYIDRLLPLLNGMCIVHSCGVHKQCKCKASSSGHDTGLRSK